MESRKRKEIENKEQDVRKKIEDKNNQKIYGETLNFQSNISQRMKKNYGSMTDQEKRMNKEDLRSFKDGMT